MSLSSTWFARHGHVLTRVHIKGKGEPHSVTASTVFLPTILMVQPYYHQDRNPPASVNIAGSSEAGFASQLYTL